MQIVTKARVTVTPRAVGEFHFAATRRGEAMPFAQGVLREPNMAQAKAAAWRVVDRQMSPIR